jgi:ABC-type uncharacterized transport system ATPase subunit
MVAIWRSFGPLEVLRGVDFDLRPGEVHALLGENGAGKSTLARILAGSLAQDSGAVRMDGVDVSDRAERTGRIAMVHQHFMLVPSLTVAENIALPTARGRLPRKELGRIADEVEALGERLGMATRGSARVDTLSVGEQQRVEIIRALHAGARYLILDEPTANLAPVEVNALLDHMRGLTSAEGIGLAIITHHLDEVIAVADRVTVLRGGDAVATLAASETTQPELARLMVGRAVETNVQRRATSEPGEVVLRLAGVSTSAEGSGPALDGVDLEVRAGEVVGIAGVEGNGQAELEAVVAGLRPAQGTLEIAGIDMTGTDPAGRLAAGLSVIASDRYRDAVVQELGVDANMAMTTYRSPAMGARFGLSWKAIRDHAHDRHPRRCTVGRSCPAGGPRPRPELRASGARRRSADPRPRRGRDRVRARSARRAATRRRRGPADLVRPRGAAGPLGPLPGHLPRQDRRSHRRTGAAP